MAGAVAGDAPSACAKHLAMHDLTGLMGITAGREARALYDECTSGTAVKYTGLPCAMWSDPDFTASFFLEANELPKFSYSCDADLRHASRVSWKQSKTGLDGLDKPRHPNEMQLPDGSRIRCVIQHVYGRVDGGQPSSRKCLVWRFMYPSGVPAFKTMLVSVGPKSAEIATAGTVSAALRNMEAVAAVNTMKATQPSKKSRTSGDSSASSSTHELPPMAGAASFYSLPASSIRGVHAGSSAPAGSAASSAGSPAGGSNVQNEPAGGSGSGGGSSGKGKRDRKRPRPDREGEGEEEDGQADGTPLAEGTPQADTSPAGQGADKGEEGDRSLRKSSRPRPGSKLEKDLARASAAAASKGQGRSFDALHADAQGKHGGTGRTGQGAGKKGVDSSGYSDYSAYSSSWGGYGGASPGSSQPPYGAYPPPYGYPRHPQPGSYSGHRGGYPPPPWYGSRGYDYDYYARWYGAYGYPPPPPPPPPQHAHAAQGTGDDRNSARAASDGAGTSAPPPYPPYPPYAPYGGPPYHSGGGGTGGPPETRGLQGSAAGSTSARASEPGGSDSYPPPPGWSGRDPHPYPPYYPPPASSSSSVSARGGAGGGVNATQQHEWYPPPPPPGQPGAYGAPRYAPPYPPPPYSHGDGPPPPYAHGAGATSHGYPYPYPYPPPPAHALGASAHLAAPDGGEADGQNEQVGVETPAGSQALDASHSVPVHGAAREEEEGDLGALAGLAGSFSAHEDVGGVPEQPVPASVTVDSGESSLPTAAGTDGTGTEGGTDAQTQQEGRKDGGEGEALHTLSAGIDTVVASAS